MRPPAPSVGSLSKRGTKVRGACAGVALLLGACQSLLERPTAASRTLGVNSEAQKITVALGAEPQTLDPGRSSDSTSSFVIDSLFAGLVDLDPTTLEPVPDVAERWEIDSSGRHYTFYLRPSLWSDGAPLTAHDFVFAWRRLVDPRTASPSATSLKLIAGAEAILAGEAPPTSLGVSASDDHVLEIELTEAAPYFFQLLAHALTKPVPRHVFSRLAEVHQAPERWIRSENLVSNGAFCLKQSRFKRDIQMTRNPRYWDAKHVALEEVVLQIVENDSTLTNLYLSGAIDWTGPSGDTTLPIPYLEALSHRRDFVRTPALSTAFYWLNTTHPPLDDARVRQALGLAIDREALCKNLLRGGQIPSADLVPMGLPQYPPVHAPLFDPTRAKKLWEQAQAAKTLADQKLTLTYNTAASHKQVAEAIAAMWQRHLGLEVELVNQEWQVFLATVERRDFDIARLGWVGDYADPINFLDELLGPHASNNASGWHDPAFFAALDEARHATHPQARLARLHEAEQMVLEQQPLVPLFMSTSQQLIRDDVCGIKTNLLGRQLLKRVWRAHGAEGCAPLQERSP